MRRLSRLAGVAVVATLTAPWLGVAAAGAATSASGNVTTCADVGFAGDTQLGVDGSDGLTQSGFTVTSDGSTLVLQTVPDGVQVDALVVKGGDGYTLYVATDLATVPTGPLQAPLVGNPPTNIPTISHWFLCYQQAPGDGTGGGDTGGPGDTPTAAPTVAGHTSCTKGISVELGNLDGEVPVTFTVTTPDGSSEQVAVRGGQIVKHSYAVAEGTTGTVRVSAPGLATTIFRFANHCTRVLGEKVVKAPRTPRTDPATLPFTGFPIGVAAVLGALLVVVGTGLASAGRSAYAGRHSGR